MTILIVKYTLVILHIITAAAWFGLALPLARQARTVVDAGGEAGRTLADSVGKSVKIMTVFAVLTWVFGMGSLFAGGGFAKYGWPYHTSITLILLLVLVQYFGIQRGWTGLTNALGSDADAAQSAAKRVAATTGAGHFLWLTTLILMFWNQLTVGM